MIYSAVMEVFNFLLWMLIDSKGQVVLTACLVNLIVFSSGYLLYDYWKCHEMEKTRRSSNAGSQWKGAEGENENST